MHRSAIDCPLSRKPFSLVGPKRTHARRRVLRPWRLL
jgi:hypothetical protein